MNERIKEIADQINVCYMPRYDIWQMNTVTMEKFAKLIVQDCLDLIQKEVSLKYKDGGESEDFMGGHYVGSLLARVKIKQHFGIEQ